MQERHAREQVGVQVQVLDARGLRHDAAAGGARRGLEVVDDPGTERAEEPGPLAGRDAPGRGPTSAHGVDVPAQVAGPLDEMVLVDRCGRDAIGVLQQQVRQMVGATAAHHPEDEDRLAARLHRRILAGRGRLGRFGNAEMQ